jgi:hypothetical protein
MTTCRTAPALRRGTATFRGPQGGVDVVNLSNASAEMRTGWETCTVHERSRPIPADPARSRMTWANDRAERPNWTVVAVDTVLQNQ